MFFILFYFLIQLQSTLHWSVLPQNVPASQDLCLRPFWTMQWLLPDIMHFPGGNLTQSQTFGILIMINKVLELKPQYCRFKANIGSSIYVVLTDTGQQQYLLSMHQSVRYSCCFCVCSQYPIFLLSHNILINTFGPGKVKLYHD